MPDGKQSARTSLKKRADDNKREIVDVALRLLGRPSKNPPVIRGALQTKWS
jgi:hypothetical protein